MEPKHKTISSPAEHGGLLDFARLGHLFLRRWPLVALGVILGAACAMLYLARTPRIYSATAVLQVAQGAHDVMKFRDAEEGEDYRSPEIVKTFEQMLTSGTLLLRVVQANHLADDPSFAPPKPGGAPYADSELIERLAARISVAIRRGTRLIDVTVEDRDPAKACRLASSLVEQFGQLDLARKLETSRANTEFLASEERRLKDNLERSEEALAKYRADHQAVSLEDKQNIVVAKLKELNDRVTEAKGKRLLLEGDIARVADKGATASEQLLQLTSISSVPAVADLVRQINAKEAEFAAIKERYMWKHIKYIEAQTSLDKLKTALAAETANAAVSLKRAYQAARENEGKLETALADQEKAALTLDSVAIPYNALLRQTESDRALYENVLTRMKETSLAKEVNAGNDLRLVQAPTAPYRPSKPSRLKTLALGLVAGTVAGAAMVLLLELLNHTLQTMDQAESLLGLPLLAGVPELRRRGRRSAADAPTLIDAEDAPQREAFRTLRTTLSAFKIPETRSFLFTSAIPAEGKSFCALNFAATLARQGCHTLLIAADLRRPDGYTALFEAKDRPGLSDCLAGPLPLAQAVHGTNAKNLFVCPTGQAGGDPAGLLAGERFAELLREALTVFDRVIIDSPPINAVADALLIAPHVSAVCLVVRSCHTPVKAVLRACRTLARSEITPAGFVFNRLSMGLGSQGAYYYYGEGYEAIERAESLALAKTAPKTV